MRSRQQFAIALSFAFIACSPAIAATPIGKAVQASTTVSANGRTLQRSSPIFLNDVLRSNATGVGQFVFDDGTKLAMGPSASLTIDKSIYKGASAQRASIQASKGAFRYISGAFSGKKIATPYGTIGIRGTAFDFTIRNGRVYVLLFRGAVSFCGGGGCKTLTRTCDFLVAGGGKVSTPQALSAGMESGLNVNQAFPLLANQGRLGSQFRQAGKNCFSRAARRGLGATPAGLKAALGSTSEPPGPAPDPDPDPGSGPGTSKSNKGFGNGDEGDGSRSDNDNPGKGHGGPHGKK
ncbi:FecR family protein [Taklimakanibacter deserti]|uniref:FecR family protein n=1 Tax=Taklimakanibacter deserti TaxID=2267839 RepID=UPI0013C4C4AA